MRYEAWDLPTAATFTRKVADIPVVDGRGYVAFNDGGEGSITVPRSFDRLPQIISDTFGSLIRVYDGDSLVHEWVTERVSYAEDTVTISGPDIDALLDKAVVYPYDYPVQPSADSDWYWGSGTNLITNGGFEAVGFITNEGFEDGTTVPWWAGAVDGISATLEIEGTEVDSGTYAAKCTPLLSEGGMSTSVDGLWEREYYTVSMRVKAGSGKSIQFELTGPPGMWPVSNCTIVEISENEHAARLSFTATGSYETQTFIVAAAPGQTAGQVNIRDASGTPAVFYVDVCTLSGYGGGMEPWQVTTHSGVAGITASTEVTPDEGVRTGKIIASDANGIYQRVDGLTPGVTYTATVKLVNTSGSARWAVELRDVFNETLYPGYRLAQTSVPTSSSWQTITMSVTLAANQYSLLLYIVNVSGGDATVYADSVALYRGQPAATPGAIVGALMDDATSDHAADTRGTLLTWLDYTGFDASNDSGSTGWASSITFTAYRGDTYLNVLRSLADLGYEWRITPKAVPSAGDTHTLELYEPDGLGTDYTTAATPTVLAGAATDATTVQRVPAYSAVLTEGEEGAYAESSDSTAVTNFGRWEKYWQYADTTASTVLATYASELLAAESSNRAAIQAEIYSSPDHPHPLVDYTVGDQLLFQVPGLVAPTGKRIRRISYDGDKYQVTGSKVFPGETGMAEAVRRLLARYDPLRRQKTVGSAPNTGRLSQGGMASILVAGSDASDIEKAKADFVATGDDDTETLRQAIAAVPRADYPATNAGELVLTGTFTVDIAAATGYALQIPVWMSVRGLGGTNVGTWVVLGTDNSGGGGRIFDIESDARIENIGFSATTSDAVNAIYINAASGRALIRNCSFGLFGAPAIKSTLAFWMDIDGCYFQGNSAGDLNLYVTQLGLVRNCYFTAPSSGGGGDMITLTTGRFWITNNRATGALNNSFVYASNPVVEVFILGNRVTYSGTGTAAPMIDLPMSSTPASDIVIDGNWLWQAQGDGIALTLCDNYKITNNVIESAKHHGIHLDDCNYGIVEGNLILDPGSSTANTYDGIFVEGDSDENNLFNNYVRVTTSGRARYGLNISASTCNANAYLGNRVTGTTGTGAYNDAGTSSVNTWPGASAPQGDNLT